MKKEIILTVLGAPRTKKNSQKVTKRKGGRGYLVLPSDAFTNWQKTCKIVYRESANKEIIIDYPVNCRAVFYRDRNGPGDAVNYYQGLADLLQHFNVVEDDKWIKQWDGSRIRQDKENPRVEVWLTKLE